MAVHVVRGAAAGGGTGAAECGAVHPAITIIRSTLYEIIVYNHSIERVLCIVLIICN